MNWTPAIGALCAVMALTGTANALTLTNRDPQTQIVTVSANDDMSETMPNAFEGDADALTRALTLAPGEESKIMCPEGCTLALSNGTWRTFDGQETITIENGDFVVGQ